MHLFRSILVDYKVLPLGGKECVVYARGFKWNNWVNHFKLDI